MTAPMSPPAPENAGLRWVEAETLADQAAEAAAEHARRAPDPEHAVDWWTERLLDAALRAGAYGDGFGADPDGLSLARLKATPHGIDLGALEPRIPEVLRTPSGRVELCPAPIVADVARLLADLAADGVPPSRTEVARPTLDDVFLDLTGRSLRETQQSASTDTESATNQIQSEVAA